MEEGIRKAGRFGVATTVGVILLLALVGIPTASTASAATSGILTTSMVPYDALQTTLSGTVGASVTFNSTLSADQSVLVFGTIVNQAGQTVAFQVLGTTIPAYMVPSMCWFLLRPPPKYLCR
jgi:hypothetical protein